MSAFDACHAASECLRSFRPLPLSVSTITFTGTLNVKRIDLAQLALGMEIGEEEDDPFRLGCVGSGGGGDENPRKRKPRRFHNQLPLVTPGGKAVKVFHNGSIHVTGCASPVEFLDVVSRLCAFMPTVCQLDAPPRLEDFDAQMINANFVMMSAEGCHVRLRPKRLRAELSALAACPADFETERHPGIKLVVCDDAGTKVATVMVFQTGSVQISGAKKPAHVAKAFADVCRYLETIILSKKHDIMVRTPTEVRTTTARQAFHLVLGYPATLYNACLS